MKKMEFKTNIKCGNCIANVTPLLDETLGKGAWQVDTSLPEKKMTVEGNIAPEEVIKAVEKAGYKASLL
jgi:copper chaperone